MSRILRLYVIREVALPTLLTLITILFVMLMGRIFKDMVNILMQPSVTLGQVAEVLMAFIPSIMVLAVPMAILMGLLIGVGRMTLDREMLAARASGINLFGVFWPMILLGLGVSVAVMALGAGVIPGMLKHGLKRMSALQYAMVTSLAPGQIHRGKDLNFDAGDLQFYFRERDPKDPNVMKGLTLKLEQETDAWTRESKARKKAEEQARAALGGDKKDKDNEEDEREEEEMFIPSLRRRQLTLITAEAGAIQSTVGASEATSATADVDGQAPTEVVLTLKNGAVHRFNPDPEDRQYMVIRFGELEKRLFADTENLEWHKTASTPHLVEIIRDETRDDEVRGLARKALAERHATALASFVFVLVGIPLAIWVRPSGKSWGILLAVGLMLVYFLLMNVGLRMVQYDKPFGLFVTFSPVLLFMILGGGLWWHSVRS